MFRMNGTPRAQDAQERCLSVSHAVWRRSGASQFRTLFGAGAVPLNLAQGHITCLGAEVVQYLTAGLAVNTSM